MNEPDYYDYSEELSTLIAEMRHDGYTWQRIKELVVDCEANENEAASLRALNEPGAWEGGFAANH